MAAGWNGIEDWKCASKGCCYDNKGPFTVGTDNTKVSQPVCFFPNGAASNYDLNGSFKAAGTSPPVPPMLMTLPAQACCVPVSPMLMTSPTQACPFPPSELQQK